MRRAKRKSGGKAMGVHRGLSVGVVSAQASEREAVVIALNELGRGLRAIDCGSGVAESVVRARDLAVDVALVALDPGPAASFSASLRSAAPEISTVVLLRSESEAALVRLASAGVVGFVPPASGLSGCERTLRAVRRHGFDCPPELAPLVLRGRVKGRDTTRSELMGGGLRGRRLEVAECVAGGLSNKEIGDQLNIAAGTVKNHVHAVLAALGVEHRWQVAAALRLHPARLEVVRGKQGEETP